MQSNNKLTIPDLISIGVFTAIYFVLVTIATFASTLLLPGVSNIFLPAIAALISGSVYMLLAAKLQKFGGITIMGLVMGLFFFVSGHFVLSFAANILVVFEIPHPFPLNAHFGTLTVGLGSFPFDYETYLTQSDSQETFMRHSEFDRVR